MKPTRELTPEQKTLGAALHMIGSTAEIHRLMQPIDCRTCVHSYGKPFALGCSAIGACVAGERYEALPVAQLWRKT